MDKTDMAKPKSLQALVAERFGEAPALDDQITGAGQLAAILGHCSHRSFTSDPIAPGLLRLLCACALSAPAKSDLQQADIVHVADAEKRRQIEVLIPSMPWIAEAPVFLVFCGNSRRIREICRLREKPFANDHLDAFFNAAVDTALVLMNFIRAAEAAGLVCCPISVIRNHAEQVSRLLRLPDRVFPVAGLCVGYPARERRIVPRLPLELTLHTDEYNDDGLAGHLDEYDRRRHAVLPFRQQRYADDYGEAGFYGWSEDKARQVSRPERADFGAFIRSKRFNLD